MQRWKKMAFLATCLFVASWAESAISIQSWDEIDKKLTELGNKDLVVFDVDDVLIISEDHVFHPSSQDFMNTVVKNAFVNCKSNEEKKELEEALSLAYHLPKRVLIEQKIASIIKDLQSRGVKVIALTSCKTGKFGNVQKIEDWRVDHLRSLGIDFASAFPAIGTFEFSEMKKVRENPPLFHQGILFSHGYEKGDVLAAFLNTAGYKPDHVLFFDDLIENVESVESSMKTLDVSCLSVQYLGASKYYQVINPQIIEYQFEYLKKNKAWITDKEVQEKLFLGNRES